MKKQKANIDDGCNPELVKGTLLDGKLGIPTIKKPKHLLIPSQIVPFSEIKKVNDPDALVCFNEHDINFSDVIKHPEEYIDVFKPFAAIASLDCSLYRDAPLSVQIINVYKSRAIGSFHQKRGLYVIPLIRWGSEETYTTSVLPEKVAFLGVEKHSIVLIGTYGCIKSRDDKYHFKAGLKAMLETLEPEIVLVYGPMPDSIFGEFLDQTRFIQYDDWITKMHRR